MEGGDVNAQQQENVNAAQASGADGGNPTAAQEEAFL